MPVPTDLITPHQAARIASVDPSTMRRWIRQGRLRRYRRVTSRIWVSRAEVERLIMPVEVLPRETVRTREEEAGAAAMAEARARAR